MKLLSIIAGIALLLAIPSGWDYSYYILLRWFVFVAAGIIAYGFYNSKLPAWAFIFGGVSFLFNPLIPVYLAKNSWTGIDFITAILFFVAAYTSKNHKGIN